MVVRYQGERSLGVTARIRGGGLLCRSRSRGGNVVGGTIIFRGSWTPL